MKTEKMCIFNVGRSIFSKIEILGVASEIRKRVFVLGSHVLFCPLTTIFLAIS